jgi:hypothetical protein
VAVTAHIGGVEAGGPPGGMAWDIFYDDATRQVTTSATDAGWCWVQVQITAALARTIAYYPSATGLTVESQNPDLAARMQAADFRVVADGSTVVLASNVPAAQVQRIGGKGGSVSGFQSTSEWSRV